MQFHGTADRYMLNGATAVATLYSNATTATANPAVTLRWVGSSGGQAAAFTYDLARSVVYTRQGNPAWAGQERDGDARRSAPTTSSSAAPRATRSRLARPSKIAIPQADEQQRLLGEPDHEMNRDRKPMPRFWYLPRGEKAAVVMTRRRPCRRRHGRPLRPVQGSSARPAARSRTGSASAARPTSIPNSPLTNAQAASYVADGFEVALHVEHGRRPVRQLDARRRSSANYTSQLARSREVHERPGAQRPSGRMRRVERLGDAAQDRCWHHGIRLDTNYYHYPASWIAGPPGFMTGSGMPMRFADLDGTLIDVYQAAHSMTDESDQTYPSTVNALLDKAVGAEGYYGVFTANMHTDSRRLARQRVDHHLGAAREASA